MKASPNTLVKIVRLQRSWTLLFGGDGLQQFLQRFHLIGNEHRT
jgi:hypothetical protein